MKEALSHQHSNAMHMKSAILKLQSRSFWDWKLIRMAAGAVLGRFMVILLPQIARIMSNSCARQVGLGSAIMGMCCPAVNLYRNFPCVQLLKCGPKSLCPSRNLNGTASGDLRIILRLRRECGREHSEATFRMESYRKYLPEKSVDCYF
jgi:hypothetical protein